jgi:hypothetical protein
MGPMPNKMIWVREDDLDLFERAEEFARQRRWSLSTLIAVALQHYMEDQSRTK